MPAGCWWTLSNDWSVLSLLGLVFSWYPICKNNFVETSPYFAWLDWNPIRGCNATWKKSQTLQLLSTRVVAEITFKNIWSNLGQSFYTNIHKYTCLPEWHDCQRWHKSKKFQLKIHPMQLCMESRSVGQLIRWDWFQSIK